MQQRQSIERARTPLFWRNSLNNHPYNSLPTEVLVTVILVGSLVQVSPDKVEPVKHMVSPAFAVMFSGVAATANTV